MSRCGRSCSKEKKAAPATSLVRRTGSPGDTSWPCNQTLHWGTLHRRPLYPLLCLLDCLWEGLALRFGSVSDTNSLGSVRRLGAALGNKGSAGKSLQELCVWHHLWPFAERGTRIHPSSRTIMSPVRRQQLPLATSLGGQVK